MSCKVLSNNGTKQWESGELSHQASDTLLPWESQAFAPSSG
jgi:hypothetical protein